VKITEKTLKQIVTNANLGPLKATTFGLALDRKGSGYEVSLVARDSSTPPTILLKDGTASEAAACIEGVLSTHKTFTTSMLGSTAKPEFATQEHFIRQAGERCPLSKCNSKNIQAGWIKPGKGVLEQIFQCQSCGLEWIASYKLDDYDLLHRASVP